MLPSIKVPKEISSFHLLPDDHWDHKAYLSSSSGTPNTTHNCILGKPAAYLTLPTGGNTQTQEFGCDYIRVQELPRPSPKLRRILQIPSCALSSQKYDLSVNNGDTLQGNLCKNSDALGKVENVGKVCGLTCPGCSIHIWGDGETEHFCQLNVS